MVEPDARQWHPLAEVPQGRALHIVVRTPGGDCNSYRWLPYKPGSQPPYVGGRWQRATEHGWTNAPLPEAGEFALNPSQRVG